MRRLPTNATAAISSEVRDRPANEWFRKIHCCHWPSMIPAASRYRQCLSSWLSVAAITPGQKRSADMDRA